MAVAIAFLPSCDKIGVIESTTTQIKVYANTSRGIESKSGASSELRGVYSAETGDLVMEEYVSDYGFLEESGTKGAVITDARTSIYPANHNPITGKTIYLEAWLHSGIDTADKASDDDKTNHHFIQGETITYSGSKWNTGRVNYWRDGIASSFWSYVEPDVGTLNISWPGNKPTNDDVLKSINFDYSLPNPGTTDNDAETLEDFLFAYNEETRNIDSVTKTLVSGQNNYFNIHFYHPLAAVKFDVGTISGDSSVSGDEYVNITKVEIVNVAQSGSFTAAGSASGVTFTCTPSTSDTKTYSQAVTREQIRTGKFTSSTSDCVFFMIPQNVDNVTVRLTMTRKKKNITYDIDGTTILSTSYGELITFTREVSLSGNWESGKYYTYKINSNVYFGGETVTLPNNPESSGGITVDASGNLTFNISGRTEFSEWVAPLPTRGVNVLKLTFTHTYTNSSGKSARRIWLGDASVNPEWTGPDDTVHPHFINRDARKTYDSDLVAEAVTLTNASTYWGSPVHYTGYLGEYTIQGNGQVLASAYDKNMNNSGGATNIVSTMYFYLGGNFDYVTVHFEYLGSTGGGSVGWSASIPIFNVTEVIE